MVTLRMKKDLEATWWWRALCIGTTSACMPPLMKHAGVLQLNNFAAILVFMLCFFALTQAFSSIGWLIVLCTRPARITKKHDTPG